MNLEQYIGCVIKYRGRLAIITGTRSNYDGDCFYLQYAGKQDSFQVNAFDADLMDALPDPLHGILKRKDGNVVFEYSGTEYVLGDHPYEPCLYIKKDGAVFRTLHNAFTADYLPEHFAEGRTLTGIDGKEYGLEKFCRVLAAAIDSDRSQMDFPFAAKLVREDEE